MLKLLLISTTMAGVLGVTSRVLEVVMTVSSLYLLLVLVFALLHHKREAKEYTPTVSVLIPAHNEEGVIERTVEFILGQHYPHMEVIVIDDASSDSTPHILYNLQQRYPKLKVLRRELTDPRGKPAALNDALKLATGEVIAVFDSDTEIERDFMSKVVPHLAGRKVGGVQAKVRMYNRNQNMLTMVQDSEFALYCSVMQAGRDMMGGYCGLGGNGQFVKRIVLEAVGGWMTGMLAEDFDLTLTMLEAGYRVKYVNVPVYQEAVSRLRALFRQRNRWSQGGIQSTLRHFKRLLLSKRVPRTVKLDTLYVFSTVLQPFILLASFATTFVDMVQHGHLVIHWGHMDPYTTAMFAAYFLFIIAGHLMGKPEDWKWLVPQVLLYYVYSTLWAFVYLYSMGHYCMLKLRRRNIQWTKTVHVGTTPSKGVST